VISVFIADNISKYYSSVDKKALCATRVEKGWLSYQCASSFVRTIFYHLIVFLQFIFRWTC